MNPQDVIDGITNTESGSSSGKMTWGDVMTEIIIPDGAYHIRVKKAKYVEPTPDKKRAAEAKGDEAYPYTAVQLVVQTEGEFFGQIIFENLTHRPGFMFLLRQLAEATGLDLEELAGEEYNPAILVDRECYAIGEVVDPTEEQKAKGYGRRFRTKKFVSLDEIND